MTIQLFEPIRIRDLKIRNKVFMAPMCQYSAEDSKPNDWHLIHLGGRAVGGAGLVMSEAVAVLPEGRISAFDLGIWSEDQIAAFKPITAFIKEQGSASAIQLAHAGRKASGRRAWGRAPNDGWEVVGPSPLAYDEGSKIPHELTTAEIDRIVDAFRSAAENSIRAGFDVAELHLAHGYLACGFLSPTSNRRTDEYGGSLENRARFALRISKAVRDAWPDDRPVFARISATEWVDGGISLDESILVSKWLKDIGIDLIDTSSGGNSPNQRVELSPGYQVHLASVIRSQAEVLTGAVGLITEATHAEKILQDGDADVIFLGRELLRNPYWPLHAASELGAEIDWVPQYLRAKV